MDWVREREKQTRMYDIGIGTLFVRKVFVNNGFESSVTSGLGIHG